MENTRAIVLEVLTEAEKDQASYGRILSGVLDKYNYLDRRDKAFIKLLAEGTVDRRITLDFILDKKSSVKTHKMKPVIRNILRMGVYQIIFTDSPAYAVVKESVALAGKRGFKGLGGFVNGVLRNIAAQAAAAGNSAEERLSVFLPARGEMSDEKYFSIRYSLPEFISEHFISELGDRAESVMSSMSGIRGVTFRFSLKLSPEEVAEAVGRIEAAGVQMDAEDGEPRIYHAFRTGDIRSLPGYDEGLFNVQDLSSYKAVLSAGITKGDKVLDLCAAPGGKTVLASELAGDEGSVTSCDISDYKADLITENITRMNCRNVRVLVRDATVPVPEDEDKYDVVIMDVPCSGLGVIGKKRDIKYNLTPEGMESLCELQKKIADAGVRYVRKGGILMYSTCTIRRAENEDRVRYITENYPFTIVKGPVQLLPDEATQDGFFYTILRKA